MIEFTDLAHAAELDAYVRAHPACHFMQTSLWGRVKSDWGWRGLLCRASDGSIRGTMAILEHRLRFANASLLYAPRGPIFDDRAAFEALIAAAKEYAAERRAYLLRIDPAVSENDAAFAELTRAFRRNTATDFSLFQPRICYCIDLRGKTEESLLAGYHPSTRRNIRLAERNGVTVRQGSADDLPAFCAMMRQTAEKNHFHARNEPYFRAFLREMGENAALWIAEKDEKPLAATISATYGRRSWFMYGCSDRNALHLHPNEALQWAMQKQALHCGCERFDLRGVEGYPTEDNPHLGLHRFKQGFGAELCAYVGQLDLVLRPKTEKIVQFLAR